MFPEVEWQSLQPCYLIGALERFRRVVESSTRTLPAPPCSGASLLIRPTHVTGVHHKFLFLLFSSLRPWWAASPAPPSVNLNNRNISVRRWKWLSVIDTEVFWNTDTTAKLRVCNFPAFCFNETRSTVRVFPLLCMKNCIFFTCTTVVVACEALQDINCWMPGNFCHLFYALIHTLS